MKSDDLLRRVETEVRGVLADAGVVAQDSLKFVAAADWQGKYCRGAMMVIHYGYGRAAEAFDFDAALSNHKPYSILERMAAALEALGVYTECGTREYSGVYLIRDAEDWVAADREIGSTKP